MRDVVIAGGGIAGLSLALALRTSFGERVRIALVDATLDRREPSALTSALSLGSRHLLDAIGVWPRLAPLAQPIMRMEITDSRRQDAVRPLFLTFDEPTQPGEPQAYMIRNGDLLALLESDARAAGVELIAGGAHRLRSAPHGVDAILSTGATLTTRLLVAADGAGSRVRRMSGLEIVSRDYGRAAIVATLAHDEDHHGCATQHFLPAGPFAMLPLTGRRSSIVWTEETELARRLIELAPEDFAEEATRRFGRSLGRLSLVDRPAAFPLRAQIARRFVKGRVALIGDAAHVVHPLAGQGVNLAFRDIAALVDVLAEPFRLGLDPGAARVLRAYEQARYFDTVSMVAATDGLHALFATDSRVLRAVRDVGLGVVDRLPGLKRLFAREAAGLGGETPRLLRGRRP